MEQNIEPPSASAVVHLNAIPLCVDLDSTLLKTDLLWEGTLLLIKRNPFAGFLLPFWLTRGRAYLKRKVAEAVALDITLLPYRGEILRMISEARGRGRRVVLVSAADKSNADRVARHLDCFDEVIVSHDEKNLKGAHKSAALEEKFGRGGFDYAGDEDADLLVWAAARSAIVVSDNRRLIDRAQRSAKVEIVPTHHARRIAILGRALRLHQWTKNLLVFVPVITSHRILEQRILLSGFLAFFSFSLFCSGVYLINDLLDLEADRQHSEKRFRALAAGELSIPSALLWAAGLLGLGIAVGTLCGVSFLICLALYGVGNLAYSIWIKRVVMLDVVVLACFYSLRLLAGGAATGIGCSEWLLAFSVFFFFGLAMIKRYSELRQSVAVEGQRQDGRGYFRSDLDSVASFGVSSGLISVLVLVLYVMSPEVRIIYHRPSILLLLCPLLLYWITRLWFKAHRSEVPQDPVVFALTDRTSYITGILAVLVLYAATI